MGQVLEKENAAVAAMDYVQNGMTLGLGTGSTAELFIAHLSRAIAGGLMVHTVATSVRSAQLARSLNVPLLDCEQIDRIHLTVDGADEIDPDAQLVKGGGGALLREKIIASASDVVVIIADSSKQVDILGRFPLPVEIVPFGYMFTLKKVDEALRRAGIRNPELNIRMGADGECFVSDGGNLIIDCQCTAIPDVSLAAGLLSAVPGIVEHGLFINLARTVIIGKHEGADIRDY